MAGFVAYVGFNGIDSWDVIFGDNEAHVRADAERSADRCFKVEGVRPTIEVVQGVQAPAGAGDFEDDFDPRDDGCLEAEDAWTKAAEYDQESQDCMHRGDMMAGW